MKSTTNKKGDIGFDYVSYQKSITEANYTDEEKIMIMHSYIAKARAFFEIIDDEYKQQAIIGIGETLKDMDIELSMMEDDDEQGHYGDEGWGNE